MTQLELYTNAVAKRKAITKRGDDAVVNYAVVAQLEEDDIPRLLEIVRMQKKAIDYFREIEPPDDSIDMEELVANVRLLHQKVEALAADGSHADWGMEPSGH